MALGLGGLDQQLNDKVATFGSMPESELAKKVKLSSGLLDALAAEKVLQQKAAAARELSLSQESSPKTIIQKNEEEVLRNTQQELANQVDGTLKNKQAKRTKNMNRMAGMDPRMLQAMQKKRGLAAAPVQRRQVMAQGGIVGYAEGGFLDKLKRAGLYIGDRAYDNIVGKDDGIDSVGERFARYITNNPIEAAGTAAIMHPVGRGLIGVGGKLASTRPVQKGIMGLKKLFMTPKTGVPKNLKKPDLNYKMPKETRKLKPGAVAAGTGTGIIAVDKIIDYLGAAPPTPDVNMTPHEQMPLLPTDTEEMQPEQKEPTVSDFNQKEYDEWLTNLIGVLSAKGGRGSRGRQYYVQQQQLIDNSLRQQQVDVQKQKANASDQLNRIVQDASSYEKFQGRLTAVNEEIMKIQASVLQSSLGVELQKLKDDLAEGSTDEGLPERIRLMEQAVQLEVMLQASNYGGDSIGLIAQRESLMEKLAALDNKEYDLTQTPKTVSP